MTSHFSWLTIFLLAMGWLSHWIICVRKARATALAAKTSLPGLLDYWVADPYRVWLSVICLVVLYFVIPAIATRWPELAVLIGATAENPLNPLAAYLGGIVSPWFADWSGKRFAAMVGD